MVPVQCHAVGVKASEGPAKAVRPPPPEGQPQLRVLSPLPTPFQEKKPLEFAAALLACFPTSSDAETGKAQDYIPMTSPCTSPFPSTLPAGTQVTPVGGDYTGHEYDRVDLWEVRETGSARPSHSLNHSNQILSVTANA